MRAIWKFSLDVNQKYQNVPIPMGAKLLHVGPQNHSKQIHLWYEVDTSKERIYRRFRVIATGEEIPDSQDNYSVDIFLYHSPPRYLGTAIFDTFVWHVYEYNYNEEL